MAISMQIRGRSARIAVSGRFDFQTHRDFKDTYTPLLDNAAVSEIEIEMSKVYYMDSAALGMLLLLNERAHAANKPVALVNASGTVSRVLEVANFSNIFNIRRMA
ncbi:MAG: STAS domain-containing protein [Nitrosomonadales bacterium]|nr:STAS domain-containing protein [Nitrosomonadales bacterium]